MSKKNAKETKRASSRVRTLSAAMRVVDEDTRQEFQLKRLAMLEADNFVEEQESTAMNEDSYAESDVSSPSDIESLLSSQSSCQRLDVHVFGSSSHS
jgi:lipase chaperone LimK